MKRSILRNWLDWNVPFEGYTTWLYLDVKGLLTTGVGNLVDPVEYALPLPWQHPDGHMATEAEVRAACAVVKARTDMQAGGGGAYAKLTSIRLPKSAVEVLVRRKLLANDSVMRERFPKSDAWPADAQLAVLSVMWAVGPRFSFPKMEAALKKEPPDFVAASNECSLKSNPKRSAAQKQCFLNAAKVVKEGLCNECLLGFETPAKAA